MKNEFTLYNQLLAEINPSTPEATPEVTPELMKLVRVLNGEMTRKEISTKLGIRDEKYFREHYQQTALRAGLLEMTIPDKPNSPAQKYRLTEKGKMVQKQVEQ